jgi:chemotaxis protein CheX
LDANFINPFLTSSVQVIETLINIKPVVGKLNVKDMRYMNDRVWLRIDTKGQLEKNIIFGFPERMTMNIVSKMMGGMPITEMDEICRSAVAELGNMISGNASTMLSINGFLVDITPPSVIDVSSVYWGKKAFSIPVTIDAVGEFDINIIV